jgi:hypothetical protein
MTGFREAIHSEQENADGLLRCGSLYRDAGLHPEQRMAADVPAIRVLTSRSALKKDVDARYKAGHDDQERS